jgi:hypothetical protein
MCALPSRKNRRLQSSILRWLAVAVYALFGNQAGAQILTNGGFENNLASWSSYLSSGGSATFGDNTNSHWGTNCLLVTVSAAGTASNSVQIVSSSFTANNSDTYMLRFWMNTSLLRANMGVYLLGASPVFPQIPFEISTNPVGSYQEYLYAFRATGAVSIAFNFQSLAKYWLDDVEVLDLTNNDGWDIPMTYLWQWGQLEASKLKDVGWSGGDNDKSVLLPDGSVAWIFNDSFASTLNFYSNIRGDTSLPRNSVVHQEGTNLYWLNDAQTTFFVPTNSANLYWIGGGVVESNNLLVLLNEINATAITNVGMAVATLTLPALVLKSITEVPSAGTDNYGTFVSGGDGYYYIYDGPKVARTAVGSLAVSSAWTYWTGSSWVTDHTRAVGLTNLVDPWSITQLGTSNFVAVFMPELSLTIMAQFASSPLGPWSTPVPLYTTDSQWDELNYAANICAGTGSNGVYTIGYSDDGSPEGLAKWASDKSFYIPHFITANLWQLSPYSLTNGSGGPGSRLSIKFAADQDYGADSIDNRWGAGVLNTTNWFNFPGQNGASKGIASVPYYTAKANKYISGAAVVYQWANEITATQTGTNNLALLDSFINVDNNCWYLSVTNLDAPFTNGYRLYFYYRGNTIGWGGQNYVRYYAGQTTNSAVLGTKQWNMYTTVTTNNGTPVEDLTPTNSGAGGETYGANYFVITNLSGGAFDLLITNGNYGGISAMEIVANPAVTTCTLTASSNNLPYGTMVVITSVVNPRPADGENITFMDGSGILGTNTLAGGMATYKSSTLSIGTNPLMAVYGGDGNYLASTSSVLNLTVTDPIFNVSCVPVGNFAFQLTWNASPPLIYQVQSCTNLATGIWSNVGGTYQPSGTNLSVTVFKTAAGQEYFRVCVVP